MIRGPEAGDCTYQADPLGHCRSKYLESLEKTSRDYTGVYHVQNTKMCIEEFNVSRKCMKRMQFRIRITPSSYGINANGCKKTMSTPPCDPDSELCT